MRERKKEMMQKRIAIVLLTVLLMVTLLPISVVAENIGKKGQATLEDKSMDQGSIIKNNKENQSNQFIPVAPSSTVEPAESEGVTENGTTVESKIIEGEPTESNNQSQAIQNDAPTLQTAPLANSEVLTDGDFQYTENSDGISISAYIGNSEKINVPAKIKGKSVLTVNGLVTGENRTITEINFAEGIKTIQNSVIYNWLNLRKLVLPSTLEGGITVFGTALTNADGFKKATKLSDLEISNSPITDISGLSALINLKDVNLTNNPQLVDISPLKNAKSLGNITINGSNNISTESKSKLLRADDVKIYITNGKKTIYAKPSIIDFGQNNILADEKLTMEIANKDVAEILREDNKLTWSITPLKPGTTKGVFKYDGKETGKEFKIEVVGLSKDPDQPVGEKVKNLPTIGTASAPGHTETMALYDNGQLWNISNEKNEKIMDNVKKYVGISNYINTSGLAWTMIEDNNGTLWTREMKGQDAPVINKRVENVTKYVGVQAYGNDGIVNGYALDSSKNLWNLGGNNTTTKIQTTVKDFDALGFNDFFPYEAKTGVAVLMENGDLMVRLQETTNNEFIKLENGVSSLEEDEHFVKDGEYYAYKFNKETGAVEAEKLINSMKKIFYGMGLGTKTDGTTWYLGNRTDQNYTKVLESEIKQYVIASWDNQAAYMLLDNNNTLWKWMNSSNTEEIQMQKIADNIIQLNYGFYLDSAQNVYDLKGNKLDGNVKKVSKLNDELGFLKTDNIVYINGVAVLNNVADIEEKYILQYGDAVYKEGRVLLTRIDGTVWAINDSGDPTPYKLADNKGSVEKLGDVNNDGSINASDSLLTLRHSVKEIELKDSEYVRGDVNKDAVVNASDGLQILRYSVKEINNFD